MFPTRLIAIESRDHWETHLVDIQDAGFLQKRIAQIVANRRMMAFDSCAEVRAAFQQLVVVSGS